jgi:hypothetical protein
MTGHFAGTELSHPKKPRASKPKVKSGCHTCKLVQPSIGLSIRKYGVEVSHELFAFLFWTDFQEMSTTQRVRSASDEILYDQF